MIFKKKKVKSTVSVAAVSWDEWHKNELPVATESYLISLMLKDKEYRTIICGGLPDIDVLIQKDTVTLVIRNDLLKSHEKDFSDILEFYFCITDDPGVLHAGDWSQLGCMRILLTFYDPKVWLESGRTYIQCSPEKFNANKIPSEVHVDK